MGQKGEDVENNLLKRLLEIEKTENVESKISDTFKLE